MPGDVQLTIRPLQTGNNQKVYSLANIHGDVMSTTNASGTLTASYLYDPFGNLIGSTYPDNQSGTATNAWVGNYQKLTEKDEPLSPIQMGERVYISLTGRFLQVDPVDGGTDNNYAYVNDPVNSQDLSGRCPMCAVGVAMLLAYGIAKASQAYQQNPSGANMAWLAVSMLPGGMYGKTGASWARSAAKKISGKLANGGNYLRIGRVTKGSPFRVSIGPAPSHYATQARWKKVLTPLHFHGEKAKGGLEFNWFRNSKGKTKSIKLWGSWR